MRHRKAGLKLNRTASHRKAMFRNMVTSLLKHDRIRTTDTKAKELRSWADHVITLAKRGDLHARRQAMAIVTEKEVVHKLFETAAERFGKINGGYTRIVKLGRRSGDAAPLSMIELVTVEEKKKTRKKKKTKSTSTKKTEAKPAAEKKDDPKTAKAAKKKAAPKKAESKEAPDEVTAEGTDTKKAAPKKKAASKKEEGEKKAAGGAKSSAKKKAAPKKKTAAKTDDKKEK
jgi:large subunit ribosomal protein L17